MKDRKQLMSEAREFYDESLVIAAEKRGNGSYNHDLNCWIHHYKRYCGLFGYEIAVCASNARWYRNVLQVFLSGRADTIAEAEKIHHKDIQERAAARALLEKEE